MQIQHLFQQLSSSASVLILEYLSSRKGATVQEITRYLEDVYPLRQATVSYHLRLLRQANLIYFLPDGPCHYYYCRNPVRITELMAIAKETIRDGSVFVVEREQLV